MAKIDRIFVVKAFCKPAPLLDFVAFLKIYSFE